MARVQSNGWRDKYLRVLDDYERLEQESGEHLHLLRRALLKIITTTDGVDKELDHALKGLKNALRHKVTYSQLKRYMLVVEEAITEFEKRQRQRGTDALAALRRLCSQLISLDLSSEVKGALKQFQRGLKPRVAYVEEYSPLLAELSELQARALDKARADSPSFWQRFWRGRRAEKFRPDDNAQAIKQQQGSVLEIDRADAANKLTSDENPDEDTITVFDMQPQSVNTSDAELTDGKALQKEATFQRPLHEPAFSKISDNVTRVLTDLLDNVEPCECVEQKVINAKQRIDRGLNWFELVPTLEDVRDLVMQAFLSAGKAFEDYLSRVDEELEAVCQTLGVAVDTEAKARKASESLEFGLRGEVRELQISVSDSSDLNTLKQRVTLHIDSIQSQLDIFEQDKNSAQKPLAQQLHALVERVEHMEAQAKRNRTDLEVQRRRALQDPLTELPNREAYSERVHLEYQRWKRYRNPLTLAICDIDFFKKINDSYGHQAGDRVLKVLSRGIAKRLREVDFMARYGGEEFVILLPETSASIALTTLDKIRSAIAQTPFHFKEKPVQITLSMGIAEFGRGDTVDGVFARADKLLYSAKEQGRNRCLADEVSPDIASVLIP